jgi:hypothetical protein
MTSDILRYKKYPRNHTVFHLSWIILLLLFIPAFIAAWAVDEGSSNLSFPWKQFEMLFYILRFPMHVILWPLITKIEWLYFPMIAVNFYLYALCMERVITIGWLSLKGKANNLNDGRSKKDEL